MINTQKIGELECTVVCESEAPQAAVILCHGFGAPGTDLVPIAHELIRGIQELRNVVFLFPQAPIELDPVFESRAWWMIDVEKIQSLIASGDYREMRNSNPPELQIRREQINLLIEHAADHYNLPADKIVVGGFSQGAMLATDVALNNPVTLGGLIVWSGTLLNELQWKAAAENLSALNIVQSHGRNDPILPFAGAEFLRDMLTETNHNIEFVPFDGEHTIGKESLLATARLLTNMLDA